MRRELPAPLGRLLTRLLKRTRRRYRRRLARCQEHFSETAVHQLRVETRRALALLHLMQALKLGGPFDKPRRNLKQRLGAFDKLRDAQVGLVLLARLVKQFPEAAKFEALMRKRERKLITKLRRQIKVLKPRRVERSLKALEQEASAANSATSKPAASIPLEKPLQTAFARVLALRKKIRRPDTTTIHRTRIAFKKYRYLCELLSPLLPRLTRSRLREMHAWQTRMGEIQDVEVLLCEIERAVKRDDVPLAALKRLHAALARRLAVLINRFTTAADGFEQFRP